MSPSPLVSFIVPCFNHGRYLTECLDSIFQQTATEDYEVIVVDDASTDETPRVIGAYRDPRLQYERRAQNHGTAAAVSYALTRTRGKYIARLDADDRHRREFLEITLPILEEHPALAMVYGDVAALDENSRVMSDPWDGNGSRRLHPGGAFQGCELEVMLLYNPTASQARLMRGDLARVEAPFPEYVDARFGPTDWYMNVRLARHHDVCYVPRTLADYRIHPANQHRRPLIGRAHEETVLGILNHLFAEPISALATRGLKRRVYGTAYLRLAQRYFAGGNFADARRCYLRALWLQPRAFWRAGGIPWLIGAGLGAARYAQLKHLVRRPHAA